MPPSARLSSFLQASQEGKQIEFAHFRRSDATHLKIDVSKFIFSDQRKNLLKRFSRIHW